VPLLLEQLNHDSPQLQRAVVVSLMQIGAQEALDAIRETKNKEDR